MLVNTTSSSTVSRPGVTVNEATGGGSETPITLVIVAEPVALVTLSETVLEPGVAKVCTGSETVEIVPSPKSHRQPVGAFVEVSVKVIA